MSTAIAAAEPPKEFALFDKGARRLAVSPLGKTIAVAGDETGLVLWDLAGEQVLHRLKGHTAEVRALDFSPDGQTLASGGFDKLIRIWNTDTGKERRNIRTDGVIEDICYSPDGKQLAVVLRKSDIVQLVDATTGKELRRLKHPLAAPLDNGNSRACVTFSPDGKLLVAACGGQNWPDFVGGESTISIWEVADGKLRASFPADRYVTYDLEFSPDGQQLAAATNRGKTVKLWEIPPAIMEVEHDAARIQALIKRLDSDDFVEREKAQRALEKIGPAARDALKGATRSDSAETQFRATAILKKLSHGEIQPTHVLAGSPFDVDSVAFSPDGRWLASGRQYYRAGNVILWRLGETPRRVVTPHQHGAWDVRFTTDGKQLITASQDGNIAFWKLDDNP